ncbi:MFS transporter [Thalassorhabdus alkalitolerans]|nr:MULTISPECIES: MFS transporter [Bacillaceae]
MIELKTKAFWQATLALGLSSILIFANIYYPQPLLPLFSEEFQVTPVVSSLAISLALLGLGVSFFLYSALSDAYGRKIIIMAAMTLGTLATFAIAIAPSFEVLLFIRVIQAIALAGIPTACMAYISEEYSTKGVAVAIGIFISANSIGGMGGRLLSGVVTDFTDWRTAFAVMGVLSVLILSIVAVTLPSSRNFQSKPLELKGLFLNNWEHLKNKPMRYAYIIGGLHFFVFMGIFNFVTYLLSGPPFYVSTSVLGILYLTYIAGTVSSTLAGKAAERLEQTTIMLIGISLMVISLLVTLVPSFPMIVVALLILSFGFFFVHSTSSSWVTKHADFAKASASGLYLTSYYLGGGIGSFYYGWLWSQFAWNGVIAGSLVILCITSFYTRRLKQIEKKERSIDSAEHAVNHG